ncbi:hypothetical protein IQ255_10005 [Pleurocapsales cyanobacterium LEGE 10410]|nr:hypothetical protein [Pleurocapsales cyanobacterium LEGE 10410]
MMQTSKFFSQRKFKQIFSATGSLILAIALNSCGTSESGAGQYEATAKTTLTWRVPYGNDLQGDKRPKYEKFESASLVNRNGEKPEGAVYQDDKGIWWPKNPPKPTIEEIEAIKKRPYEEIGKPELLREVEYRVKFDREGERLNLPTNYSVYRQVARNYPDTPLTFVMGVNNGSVTKATPVTN